MALGQSVSPPPELMFYLLAREFGVTPRAIAESPADDVFRWWQLHVDLTPPPEKH